MSYEVTATRRRPRTFDQLVGQEFVVATLKNSIASGRIAHAYLFAGPRGVGKTSAARILAKALNCPAGPSADACDDYEGSEEIARGTALDVIEIDGASNTSVNDVRQIKDEVLFAPNSSRYKIYIIDEVHMLSNSAFNALLKTIEEPPPYIIFIFATTEIHKVPATIRSRCQQFTFRLISLEEIKEKLHEASLELGLQAEEDALGWVAKEAGGSMRDAYTLFDQVVAFSDGRLRLELIHQKLGLVGHDRLNEFFERVAEGATAPALEIVDHALSAGVSVERFTVDLADYARSLLLLKHGVEREGVLGLPPERFPAAVQRAFEPAHLERMNELLLQLYRDLRYSVNQRFDLELVVSRLCALRNFATPEQLVTRLERLQRAVQTGEFVLPEMVGRPSEPSQTAVPASAGARDDQAANETDNAAETADTADTAPIEDTAEYAVEDAAATAPDDATDTSAEFLGISAEQVRAIIARFQTQRIGLAAVLQKARRWELAEDDLVIGFDDQYSASTANSDRDTIQSAAMTVLGRLSLRLKIGSAKELRARAGAQPESPRAPTNEQAEMVRRVFRGEIVEGNA